jgi:hypothetical protein
MGKAGEWPLAEKENRFVGKSQANLVVLRSSQIDQIHSTDEDYPERKMIKTGQLKDQDQHAEDIASIEPNVERLKAHSFHSPYSPLFGPGSSELHEIDSIGRWAW